MELGKKRGYGYKPLMILIFTVMTATWCDPLEVEMAVGCMCVPQWVCYGCAIIWHFKTGMNVGVVEPCLWVSCPLLGRAAFSGVCGGTWERSTVLAKKETVEE